MNNEKSYLTIGLHGIHDSTINITVPKYLISVEYGGEVYEGLDRDLLTEDGYEHIVEFEGDFTGCVINKLRRGDDIKVEIIKGEWDSEFTTKDDKDVGT